VRFTYGLVGLRKVNRGDREESVSSRMGLVFLYNFDWLKFFRFSERFLDSGYSSSLKMLLIFLNALDSFRSSYALNLSRLCGFFIVI